MNGLETWERQEIRKEDWPEGGFFYFKRRMDGCESCTGRYFSHIFIQICQSESEMESRWKEINYYIAVKYQSKLKKMIEKSNFYLCLFAVGRIGMKVRNEIEADTFCAKKYIFEENGKTLEEKQLEIENKIFRIACSALTGEGPKLESMALQNFRGYAGRFEIDFRDRRRKAASFVVIYAKNGVGKTSLFDGVEFALKGEIGRIVSLAAKDKKNKYTGAIYHNRDNADKEAYVSMMLEGNKQILRKVSGVAEGGNDCRFRAAVCGKEITGTNRENGKWDQIILPHNKIDSFISAKSSTEQYKEWIDTAAPLKKETREFEEAYKAYRAAQKRKAELEEECKAIGMRLESLSETQAAVRKFAALVRSYNEIEEAGQQLCFPEDGDVERYDEVINQARKYIRALDSRKERLAHNISIAREVMDKGIAACQERIGAIEEMKKALHNSLIRTQRRRELEALLQMREENAGIADKCRKELTFLEKVADYGIEKIENKYKELNRIEIETGELERGLLHFKQEVEKAAEAGGKIELKLGKCEWMDLTEDDFLQAREKVAEYDEAEHKLKELQAGCDMEEEKIRQCKEKMSDADRKMQNIGRFELPKDVQELDGRKALEIPWDIGEKGRLELYEVEERHKKASLEMQILQEEISRQEEREEELEAIYQKGLEYLKVHTEVNICPLCHTFFESWEELFFGMNNLRGKGNGAIRRRVKEVREELRQISDDYGKIYLKWEEWKKQQANNYFSLRFEYLANVIQKEKYEKEKGLLHGKQRQAELWLLQKNIRLEEFSAAGLEVWKKGQLEKISRHKAELGEIEERKAAAEEAVNHIKAVLAELLEQKNRIVRDSELYGYIEFWKGHPDAQHFSAYLQGKKDLLEDHTERQKRLQEKMDMYKDVENVGLTDCIEYMEKQANRLLDLKNEEIEYNIFRDFSEEGVKRSLRNWQGRMDACGRQKECLQQIVEESGAGHYYEKYKKACLDLERMEKECRQQETVQAKAKETFLEKKKSLETGLKEYFKQSVMDEIFKKIDPHDFMKNVDYDLSFNDKDEPQLCIRVCEKEGEDSYRPELYFSTAQLNTVAFSSFFSRALTAENLGFRTIFIDDPVGHFDDMNILGFTDLVRSILETNDCQIIMSTHDEKIFRILERKLDDGYYSSCFIRLPESGAVTWEK